MPSLSDFWLTGSGLDIKPNKATGHAKIFSSQTEIDTDDDEAIAYTLVAVLNAVARVVDIVHGRQKFQVNFSSKNMVTDYGQGIITLSADPILQAPAGFSLADSVDVLTGMALHEAAHAQYTNLEFYTEIPGNPFAGAVRNLVEDVYVETLTEKLYPGYGGYFKKYRYYNFDLGKTHPPKIEGENLMDVELNKRTMDLILMLRSTTNYQSDIARVRKAAEMIKKTLSASKFEHLRKINTRGLAIKVYNELFGNIIQHDVAYTRPVDYIDQYNNTGKNGSSTEQDANKNNISENMQQMVQNLRQEEVNVANMNEVRGNALLEPDVPPAPMVIFRRPVITEDAPEKYHQAKEEIMPYVIKLRNKLSWANTRQVFNQYDLQTGDLDQDSLYKAPFSNRIFTRSHVLETRTRNLDMALLVDCSSSMTAKIGQDKTRMDLAQNLTALFVEAMEPVNSVQTWVYGFAQDVLVNVAELYSPTLINKNRLGTMKADGTTPEGSALKYCAGKLISEGRQLVPKVLIVIADGNPNPGREKNMVKEQSRRLQNMGCKLIHISLSEQASPYGYQHSIPWSDYYTVINQFGKRLRILLEK
ncbi:MAG: VWA domain-containing protein [Firmicutes bacterium]|nr:VWA domain-containing protein [Bacillota bacterium]